MAKRKEDIAIIGMSGRFPGANNIDEFWNNLREGVEHYDCKNRNRTQAIDIGPISAR